MNYSLTNNGISKSYIFVRFKNNRCCQKYFWYETRLGVDGSRSQSSAETERSAPPRCRGAACSIATVGITNHLVVSLFLIFKSVIISSSPYVTAFCHVTLTLKDLQLLTLKRVPEAPYNIGLIIPVVPVPVALLSEAQVCSSLIAEFASSNPAEGMDVRLLCLLCAVQIAASATG